MSAIDNIAKIRSRIEEERKRLQDETRNLLKEGTKEIFDTYGDIVEAFGWVQYTPYFNDGDECVFGMHEVWIAEPGERDDEDWRDYYPYESGKSYSSWGEESKVSDRYGGTVDHRYVEAKQAVASLYSALDEDTAKTIFGDHVSVIFTKDGIDVESYEHE